MVRGPRWRWNLHGDWHGQGHCWDGQAVLGAGEGAGERGRAGDAAVGHDGHELLGHPVEGEGRGDAAGKVVGRGTCWGGWGRGHVRTQLLVGDVGDLLDGGVRPGRAGVPLVYEVRGFGGGDGGGGRSFEKLAIAACVQRGRQRHSLDRTARDGLDGNATVGANATVRMFWMADGGVPRRVQLGY